MSPIADDLRAGCFGKVLVHQVPDSALATSPARVHTMDMATMAPNEQDFTSEFTMTAQGGMTEAVTVTCAVVWFDVDFSARFCTQRPVVLSTAPSAPTTHWMQAVLPLREPLVLAPGGSLGGRISMARSTSKHRGLDISLELGPSLAGGGARAVNAVTMQVGGE